MNKVKTVLYLSYTGMTDPLGQSQVLAYLKELSKTGNYRFVVVSFEKGEAYNRLKGTIRELCSEAGIEWHPLSYTAKPPVISTFRDVKRMRQKAKELVKKKSFSLVHCRSYIPSLVGLYLKKRYRIPFLFDMRGFWADERIDGGIWKLSNPLYRVIYRYFKKKEKQFLLQADHIISLTQNARDVIWSWKFVPKKLPITVIPCCVDMKLFNPVNIKITEQKEALAKLDISDGANIISYVGSLGTWYMLPEMMAFVKQYFKAVPGAYFLVLTGETPQMVYDAASKAGVDISKIRIKKVLRTEMPLFLSLTAISLFFIKPAFSKKASSPVKQGEIMAMGIPIICNNAVGDTEKIIYNYDAGVVLEEFTTDAYNKAIEAVKNTAFDKEKIISGATEFYSLERGAQLYKQVYQSIEHE